MSQLSHRQLTFAYNMARKHQHEWAMAIPRQELFALVPEGADVVDVQGLIRALTRLRRKEPDWSGIETFDINPVTGEIEHETGRKRLHWRICRNELILTVQRPEYDVLMWTYNWVEGRQRAITIHTNRIGQRIETHFEERHVEALYWAVAAILTEHGAAHAVRLIGWQRYYELNGGEPPTIRFRPQTEEEKIPEGVYSDDDEA